MLDICRRLLRNVADGGTLSFVCPVVFPREPFSSLLPFNVDFTTILPALVEGVVDHYQGDARLTHTSLKHRDHKKLS